MHSFQHLRLAFDTHQGLQPVKAQLRACTSFISSKIPELQQLKPYTAESYRVVMKAYAIALNALEAVELRLTAIAPELADVACAETPPDVEDAGIEAQIPDTNALQGYAEFAILRAGQLVNPMELHKLPAGEPGTEEFESQLLVRSELYRAVHRMIDALQKVLQQLASPLHSLSLGEEERGKKFREAKKEFLINQIKHLDEQLEEVKTFVAEVKITRTKLEDELATVDQITLFNFSDEVPVSPGNSEPGASIEPGPLNT